MKISFWKNFTLAFAGYSPLLINNELAMCTTLEYGLAKK
jgi:hypothetical protein